jgi:hypothetical protein
MVCIPIVSAHVLGSSRLNGWSGVKVLELLETVGKGACGHHGEPSKTKDDGNKLTHSSRDMVLGCKVVMVLKLMVKHQLNDGFRRVRMTKPCPSRARMRTSASPTEGRRMRKAMHIIVKVVSEIYLVQAAE